MEIKNISLSELKEYGNNPRLINDEAIAKVATSIKEFGFKVPIIVDENNVIVAGHTRKLAAQSIGMDEIPVIIADDLTEEQIKAFRLADNKVAEFSEWDFDLLSAELDELDMDMDDFGFDEIEDENNFEQEEEDTSTVDLDENVVIVVEADTEDKLEEIFTELVEEGYQCRLLTL